VRDDSLHALLIGNWDYRDPDKVLVPLRGPEHDVKTLSDALTHPEFGLFDPANVTIERNLTRPGLEKTLYRKIDDIRPGQSLLIYYSGHGARIGQQQVLSFCGVDDVYSDLEFSSFTADKLSDWLSQCRAQATALILDCCYSGQFKTKSAGIVDAETLARLGRGAFVLTSGGNETVPDAQQEDTPSPFTAALAAILLDMEVRGQFDRLSIDDVYKSLELRDPPLRPPPQRSLHAQGQFYLASRPGPEAGAEKEAPGWRDVEIVRVSVRFDEDHVEATWDQDADGKPDTFQIPLDRQRLAAVRRLTQLADAVARSQEYREAWWRRKVRQSLELAGAMLFRCLLPEELQNRVRDSIDNPYQVVRLDLSFAKSWTTLHELPWEYLNAPGGSEDQIAVAPQLLTARARPGVVRPRPWDISSDIPDVAVVNSLPGSFGALAARVGAEVDSSPKASLVVQPRREPAAWSDFVEAVEQAPHYMVLCAPVMRDKRDGEVVTRIGFSRDPGANEASQTDWRSIEAVANALARVKRLTAVVLVTVAAAPGMDSFRATPLAARELSQRLDIPVVFVCHSPGYESHVATLAHGEPKTFVGLLLAALTRGKDLGTSVWYARERVARWIAEDDMPTFGIPGLYEGTEAPEPSVDRATTRPMSQARPRKS
jgi:hypothetical protein